VRPEPDELLQSLRASLAETIVPAIDDRWARYVATAMDLVLQHLQLRLAGEFDALSADNADMARTLGALAADVGRRADAYPPVVDALAPLPEPGPATDLASATAVNEALRGQVVVLLQALDRVAPDPVVEGWRDEVLRLVRRQVDRVNPLIAPLHMSFGPTT
jgi:hypothetical protein